jgi:hypothetical protein
MVVFAAAFLYGVASRADDLTHMAEQTHDGIVFQEEIESQEALAVVKDNPVNRLSDFVSDGCSGGLSVGWQYISENIRTFHEKHGSQPPWQSCCVAHDRAYHSAGGRGMSARQSYELRLSADRTLKDCVADTADSRSAVLSSEYGSSGEEVKQLYELVSTLMYRAVRIGGVPCTGLSWRWGYGWPECRQDD